MKVIHCERSPSSPSGSIVTWSPSAAALRRKTSSTVQSSSSRAMLPTSSTSPWSVVVLVAMSGLLARRAEGGELAAPQVDAARHRPPAADRVVRLLVVELLHLRGQLDVVARGIVEHDEEVVAGPVAAGTPRHVDALRGEPVAPREQVAPPGDVEGEVVEPAAARLDRGERVVVGGGAQPAELLAHHVREAEPDAVRVEGEDRRQVRRRKRGVLVADGPPRAVAELLAGAVDDVVEAHAVAVRVADLEAADAVDDVELRAERAGELVEQARRRDLEGDELDRALA